MSHIARALVLVCMDFRFQKAFRNFLVDQGLDNQYDLISVAGAAKVIANPTNQFEKENFEKQLSLSISLHKISEVFLINHQDCGAYGSELAKDPKREQEVHEIDLKKARQIILQKYPQLKVNLYFCTLDKKFEKVE